MESIVAWKDRANTDTITMTKNGVALTSDEMDLITKVEIGYKGVYYNSDSYPDAFDTETYKASGKLAIKLGLTGMPVGNDAAELIIYDASNTEGIVWMQIAIQVKDDAAV